MAVDPTATGSRAIFLSYAREDTDAARQIADALRGFGVDVWFDQSELRGGEAWDTKIKKQIRDCALFRPVISATTESRGEGYFRREWKQAVDRTHDMAHGVPFIVPVVIDETREADAMVPDEFMRVQWTRQPAGQPTPEFVMQVKRLLDAPRTQVAQASSLHPAAKAGWKPALRQSTGRVGRDACVEGREGRGAALRPKIPRAAAGNARRP